MKKIIAGKTYNTDTAANIYGETHPYSDAWWAIYQTRHGAFFKVVVDHDGEDATFKPLFDSEVQSLLEARANHLVEQYFGNFPEAGASERRLTIRLPGNLADRLETIAKEKGLSFNSYAMRCLEISANNDGVLKIS